MWSLRLIFVLALFDHEIHELILILLSDFVIEQVPHHSKLFALTNWSN